MSDEELRAILEGDPVRVALVRAHAQLVAMQSVLDTTMTQVVTALQIQEERARTQLATPPAEAEKLDDTNGCTHPAEARVTPGTFGDDEHPQSFCGKCGAKVDT